MAMVYSYTTVEFLLGLHEDRIKGWFISILMYITIHFKICNYVAHISMLGII